jgi:hypothetical protein
LAAQRRLMDRLGSGMASALLEGVLLKDAGVANAEPHALIGGQSDRFFPVYTSTPPSPTSRTTWSAAGQSTGWRRGRSAAARLLSFQRYALDDPRLVAGLAHLER